MLNWICPECGNECEPADRDCPICYPPASGRPVYHSPSVAVIASGTATLTVAEAVAPPAPPPLPVPLAVVGRPSLLAGSHPAQATPPPLPVLGPAAVAVADPVEEAAAPPQEQLQVQPAVIPAFLMPASLGTQTLRLPVPGFLGGPPALPPIPQTPANLPVVDGLQSLAESMRLHEQDSAPAQPPPAPPHPDLAPPIIEHIAVALADHADAQAGPPELPAPPEIASTRGASLEICDGLQRLERPVYRAHPISSGANALQTNAYEDQAPYAVPPAASRIEHPVPVLQPAADPALRKYSSIPDMANLQPLSGKLEARNVPCAPSESASVPAVFAAAGVEFAQPAYAKEEWVSAPRLASSVPFPALHLISFPPAAATLAARGLHLDGGATAQVLLPSALRNDATVQTSGAFALSLAALARTRHILHAPTAPGPVSRIPERGYWPWTAPSRPHGMPAAPSVEFDMDPAVLKAAEPPTALALFVKPPIDPNKTVEILTPIVETAAPPMAKLLPLPLFGMRARAGSMGATKAMALAEPPVGSPVLLNRKILIIPSPIYGDVRRYTSSWGGRTPGWILTATVALLIPIGAIGVVNYWILPAHRASAASPQPQGEPAPQAKENATPAPQAPPKQPPAPAAPVQTTQPIPSNLPANWKRILEISGIRLRDGHVQFLIVNHARTPVPSTTFQVTLRSQGANPGQILTVATFNVTIPSLQAGESREMSNPLQLKNNPDIDWASMRADLQLPR